MKVDELVAIDTHTHAEVSCWNPFDSYGEVETLLARLREGGAGLVEMRLGEPDLERVFVEVMNRA